MPKLSEIRCETCPSWQITAGQWIQVAPSYEGKIRYCHSTNNWSQRGHLTLADSVCQCHPLWQQALAEEQEQESVKQARP